jgi:hypothetical protein
VNHMSMKRVAAGRTDIDFCSDCKNLIELNGLRFGNIQSIIYWCKLQCKVIRIVRKCKYKNMSMEDYLNEISAE